MWRDFTRKLSSFFGLRQEGRRARRRRRLPARRAQRRRRRGAGRADRRRGVAVQRLVHRAGRPEGRRHHLRQATATRWRPAGAGAGRTRSRPNETIDFTQTQDGGDRRAPASRVHRPARLRDADAGREHRRRALQRAVQPEGRARLPVREQQPARGRDAGRRIGGARDRRLAAASTRCCTSSATR